MSNSNQRKPVHLGIVVPCFNEYDALPETNARLLSLIKELKHKDLISKKSSICYVDDGSSDRTWELIVNLTEKNQEICGIKLSRNRGHQNALLCGLMTQPGDALISIDADLQDDLDVIPEMIRLHQENGCEIVYGVRKRRTSDSFFKRLTAETYYKLMALMNVDIEFNHADYRLLSRKALNALSEYQEVNLFLRGLVRLLGFKTAKVEYDRTKRTAGESKYPLSKMVSFAWQGITSFSTAPLRLITACGVIVSIGSIALAIWGLFASLFTDKALPGWASTVVPMYFLGGVQLLSLGIIGEYIAKIYLESKARPRFQIEQKLGAALEESE